MKRCNHCNEIVDQPTIFRFQYKFRYLCRECLLKMTKFFEVEGNDNSKQIDPESAAFIEWSKENYFNNQTNWDELAVEVIEDMLRFVQDPEIKSICLNRMKVGAIEHGPTILKNPILVAREKIEEPADLINYMIMSRYQRRSGK